MHGVIRMTSTLKQLIKSCSFFRNDLRKLTIRKSLTMIIFCGVKKNNNKNFATKGLVGIDTIDVYLKKERIFPHAPFCFFDSSTAQKPFFFVRPICTLSVCIGAVAAASEEPDFQKKKASWKYNLTRLQKRIILEP